MHDSQRGARNPEWIPAKDQARLDLSELAEWDDELARACTRLGDRLGVYVAAYRPGAKARPTGLCCTFRYADLSVAQSQVLGEAERATEGIILVAFARPLERW
jgi:hypothetical protein